MKNNIFDFIIKSFLMTFGFINIFAYIYISFIRQRLPRDIPYELTEFRFYVLCAICVLYIYLIYKTLCPKTPNSVLLYILTFIMRPVFLFLQFLKNLKFIKYFWFNLVEKLNSWSWADNILFIYLSTIIPRILLLLIFMVDVFYVRKIAVFYYFIFLGFLPLLYILFIKYLENILEEYLQYLEYLYDSVKVFDEKVNDPDYEENPKAIYNDKTVTIRKYLDILYELFLDNEHDITYEGNAFSTERRYDEYKKKYNKTSEDWTINDFNFLRKEFNYVMPKLLIIKIFLDHMTNKGQKSAYIPEIKLFILCMYLVCWIYILMVSIHTLHDLHMTYKTLEILILYAEIPDDFSGYSLIFFVFITFRNCSKNFLDKLRKLYKKFKEQHFVAFDNGTIIKKEDVKPVKYSKEYLASIHEDVKTELREVTEKVSNKPFITFEDSCGLTKQDGLNISIIYDKNAEAKLKNKKIMIKVITMNNKIQQMLKIIYNKFVNFLNNIIKLMSDFIENNFVKILGFFMFAIYIYFRFLRTRLPKDIPFNLSVVGFIILVEICLIYMYIVWVHVRKPKKSNEIVTIIIEGLFQPLDALDDYFKNLYYMKKYYSKILLWLSEHCIYIFKTLIFEICFFVIPRIILISFLSLDIFYFHILHYIYYVLVLMGIILFIRRYFIYSINKYKRKLIMDFKLYVENITTNYVYGVHPSEWPENFDPDEEDFYDIPPTMCLEVEIFIDYYCRRVIKEEEPPEINSFSNTKLFFDTYRSESEDKYKIYRKLDEKYEIELQKILNIAVLCAYITKNNSENKMLKRFKIVVYSIYLICWLYILFMSIHTLNIVDFIKVINNTWETLEEPFSEIAMFSLISFRLRHCKQEICSIKNNILFVKQKRCTILCKFIKINIVKRYGPGKEAGKVTIGAGNNYVDVYNGEGITMDDIKNVMQKDDLEREQTLKLLFQQYKQIKIQESIKYLYIIRRKMWSRAAGTITKSFIAESAPRVMEKSYSTFIMTNQEAASDTSKTSHPSGVEVSCDQEDCKTINCAKTNAKCDPSTEKSDIRFHITHDSSGREEHREIVAIKNDVGEIVSYAVLHETPTPVEHAYNQYRHAETVIVQQDNNTEELQRNLNKMTEQQNNAQDEEHSF